MTSKKKPTALMGWQTAINGLPLAAGEELSRSGAASSRPSQNMIEEVREKAYGHGLKGNDSTKCMLTNYADLLAQQREAEPVAFAVFVSGDTTTGNMRLWSGKHTSIPMFLEAHGLPSDTTVTPLFTQPPAPAATYPLTDDLYPGSKDWAAADYAGRVEWLHAMYESKKNELYDHLVDQEKYGTSPAPAAQVDVQTIREVIDRLETTGEAILAQKLTRAISGA